MKFNLDNWLVFELDWKAVAAIAAAIVICEFAVKMITL